MSRPSSETLRDALTHLRTMQAHAERDLGDQLVLDAVCLRLSAAIETLATLDSILRDELFGGTWPQMWGMRNRIAHGYVLVDAAVVRVTLSRDIPALVDCIQDRLVSMDPATG